MVGGYTEEQRLQLARDRGIIVDPEDEWLLREYQWHITSHGYVGMRLHKHLSDRRVFVYLHHAIMGCPIWDREDIDHINRQPINNSRSNLRWTTHAQNLTNNDQPPGITGVRGVTPLPHGRYMAQVKRNGQHYYLGTFDTIEEASSARQAWLETYDAMEGRLG